MHGMHLSVNANASANRLNVQWHIRHSHIYTREPMRSRGENAHGKKCSELFLLQLKMKVLKFVTRKSDYCEPIKIELVVFMPWNYLNSDDNYQRYSANVMQTFRCKMIFYMEFESSTATATWCNTLMASYKETERPTKNHNWNDHFLFAYECAEHWIETELANFFITAKTFI